MTIKLARTDHPVHELIVARWSPYAFDSRPVERERIGFTAVAIPDRPCYRRIDG